MTTYKDIRGTHIKTVTTDPPAPVNGQMWYNSTTQVIKGFTSNPAGSWASATALNTCKKYFKWFWNTNICFSWVEKLPPSPERRRLTELYNGSSLD